MDARKRDGVGENHGNAGEIGRTFPWFGREDGTPRESGGFVAMYLRWCVRGNYWYFAAVSSFVSALSWGVLFLVPPSGRGGFFLSCAFAFAAVLLAWRGGGA